MIYTFLYVSFYDWSPWFWLYVYERLIHCVIECSTALIALLVSSCCEFGWVTNWAVHPPTVTVMCDYESWCVDAHHITTILLLIVFCVQIVQLCILHCQSDAHMCKLSVFLHLGDIYLVIESYYHSDSQVDQSDIEGVRGNRACLQTYQRIRPSGLLRKTLNLRPLRALSPFCQLMWISY